MQIFIPPIGHMSCKSERYLLTCQLLTRCNLANSLVAYCECKCSIYIEQGM
jgi:hypothetical protein